jgi:hypothetical protein
MKEMAGAERVTTLGYPLDEIFSSEKLKEKIVQPILDAIAEGAATPKKKARKTTG